MKLKISYYNFNRLKRALILSCIVAILITIFAVLERTSIEQLWMGLLIGFFLGLPLGFFEEFVFVHRFKHMSYISILLLKGLIYIFSAAILFLILIYLLTLLLNQPYERFLQYIFDGEYLTGVIYTLLIYDFVIVFNQYEKLLGHQLTFLYAYGKYQNPEREERIFMFLDLNSSTELAETMERERYFNFVNDFFHDISEPLLRCSARIYQYVGDEVVFTWKLKEGLSNANCVKLYFMIEERIKRKAYLYRSRYNRTPEFKAGLHCGEVIAAVVGDIKKELIYNGDAINTTARIRSVCNELDAKLLISEELLSNLKVPENIIVDDKSFITLKGKLEPIHLYSLSKSS